LVGILKFFDAIPHNMNLSKLKPLLTAALAALTAAGALAQEKYYWVTCTMTITPRQEHYVSEVVKMTPQQMFDLEQTLLRDRAKYPHGAECRNGHTAAEGDSWYQDRMKLFGQTGQKVNIVPAKEIQKLVAAGRPKGDVAGKPAAAPKLTVDDKYAKDQAKFRKEHEARMAAGAKRDTEAKAKSDAANASAKAQADKDAATAKAKVTPCATPGTCASKQ
jgi:hypothetical protein